MNARLDAYFERIRYTGPRKPDFATLDAISRAHVFAVPFENLDVQLGRPVRLDIESIFDKLVARRRGGWCYEQNGLLGWALGEIGFDVTRLAGGVNRSAAGDDMLGNHLCLKVRLDRDYLVDAGFGGSLIGPLPLAEGALTQPPFSLSLQRADGAFWRFTEDAGGAPFGFDFTDGAADETLLNAKCAFLQTAGQSPFVQNLVAQQREPARHKVLRGRVLTILSEGGKETRTLQSADELVETLARKFALDVPEIADVWPKICARHKEFLKAQAAQSR